MEEVVYLGPTFSEDLVDMAASMLNRRLKQESEAKLPGPHQASVLQRRERELDAEVKDMLYMPTNKHKKLKRDEKTGRPVVEMEAAASAAQASTLDQVERSQVVPPFEGTFRDRQLKKEEKAKKVETLGMKWFDLPATPMTEEIKQDLILLKNRKFLGPKSFYKGNDSKKLPKYFQIGTVVSGPTDKPFELTRRERKQHLIDELVDDEQFTSYARRKFLEIQAEKESGGKKMYKERRKKRLGKK